MLKVQEIREIIKLIDESSINEFTYETNGTTIIMKKLNESKAINPVQSVEGRAPEQQAEVAEQKIEVVQAEPTIEQNEPVAESVVDYDYEIVSPMVGTLYSSSSPEIDAYVSKGSIIQKDTVVCIVEAMKLFNEIEAEVTGEIVEILVEDGELVEYGQPLFRVKKN